MCDNDLLFCGKCLKREGWIKSYVLNLMFFIVQGHQGMLNTYYNGLYTQT